MPWTLGHELGAEGWGEEDRAHGLPEYPARARNGLPLIAPLGHPLAGSVLGKAGHSEGCAGDSLALKGELGLGPRLESRTPEMRTEKKTAEGEGETGEAQGEARCEGGTRGASMGGLRIPIVTVAQEINSPPPIGGGGEGGCWSSQLLSALPPNPQRTLLYLEGPILQALAPFQAREISWRVGGL